MKNYLEKILLYVVPIFLSISICYNNGYWSLYPINVYDYFQATDILKEIAMPSFSFLSLIIIPLTIAISTLLISNEHINNYIKKSFFPNFLREPDIHKILKIARRDTLTDRIRLGIGITLMILLKLIT